MWHDRGSIGWKRGSFKIPFRSSYQPQGRPEQRSRGQTDTKASSAGATVARFGARRNIFINPRIECQGLGLAGVEAMSSVVEQRIPLWRDRHASAEAVRRSRDFGAMGVCPGRFGGSLGSFVAGVPPGSTEERGSPPVRWSLQVRWISWKPSKSSSLSSLESQPLPASHRTLNTNTSSPCAGGMRAGSAAAQRPL
mmetsp:Transcript_53297/g.155123  ORF Transcript_53297/g.155123 Transcript_53297/m.155123 type:complete len:195 (+) Transcript_53297:731-1315(+)